MTKIQNDRSALSHIYPPGLLYQAHTPLSQLGFNPIIKPVKEINKKLCRVTVIAGDGKSQQLRCVDPEYPTAKSQLQQSNPKIALKFLCDSPDFNLILHIYLYTDPRHSPLCRDVDTLYYYPLPAVHLSADPDPARPMISS